MRARYAATSCREVMRPSFSAACSSGMLVSITEKVAAVSRESAAGSAVRLQAGIAAVTLATSIAINPRLMWSLPPQMLPQLV